MTSTGTVRYSSSGQRALWSSLVADYLVITTNGIGFARKRDGRLARVQPNGGVESFSTGDPLLALGSLALTRDGRLFTEVWRPLGSPWHAIVEINQQTGERDSVYVDENATFFWFAFAGASAGRFYTSLSQPVENEKLEWHLAVYFGGRFTKLGAVPRSKPMDRLAVDDRGIIYGSTFGEGDNGEVWRFDPVSGISDLLADGFSAGPSLAFDEPGQRLFIAEQLAPFRIFVVSVPLDTCIPSPKASIRTSETEISWPTQSNRLYSVEYRSTLTPNAWTPLVQDLLAFGGRTSVFARVLVGEPERLYRVVCSTNDTTR